LTQEERHEGATKPKLAPHITKYILKRKSSGGIKDKTGKQKEQDRKFGED